MVKNSAAINYSSSLSSKGQVTVPQEIRRRLGVAAGDRIEFVIEGDRTVIRPAREDPDPFEKQMGILGPFPGGEDGIKAWVSDMRDDDRE